MCPPLSRLRSMDRKSCAEWHWNSLVFCGHSRQRREGLGKETRVVPAIQGNRIFHQAFVAKERYAKSRNRSKDSRRLNCWSPSPRCATCGQRSEKPSLL